jgi:hypothetical protein
VTDEAELRVRAIVASWMPDHPEWQTIGMKAIRLEEIAEVYRLLNQSRVRTYQ